MPSVLRATARALNADGGTSALLALQSDETKPIFDFVTGRALTAVCWRPGEPQQFTVAGPAPKGLSGSAVLIYDLNSHRPRQAVRTCRAKEQPVLHDILFCDTLGGSAGADAPAHILIGGGPNGLVA